jgi:hypothetical protein
VIWQEEKKPENSQFLALKWVRVYTYFYLLLAANNTKILVPLKWLPGLIFFLLA